jgi:hypothetical protein
MSQALSPDELSWRQFALYTDLYKTYVTAVIQLTAFVFAVSGGMVSYLLANPDAVPLRWSLVLPILFNAGIAVLYFWGLWPLSRQHEESKRLAHQLGATGVPSYLVVVFMLRLFGGLHVLSIIGMLYLAIYGPPV